MKTYLETLHWEVLLHPPYSPNIALSDFHLFRSMAHALVDQRFHFYEEAKNGPILGYPKKICRFSDAEFIYCQKGERMWSLVMGNTLIEMFSFLIFQIKFVFCKKQDPLIILNFTAVRNCGKKCSQNFSLTFINY